MNYPRSTLNKIYEQAWKVSYAFKIFEGISKLHYLKELQQDSGSNNLKFIVYHLTKTS